VTEIPEHLLKRAQARRAAMGQGDAPEGDAPAAAEGAAAGSAVAPAAAAAPAKKGPAPLPTLEAEAEPAKPDSPVVAAAKRRKRVPYWAAPVLALLPLWGFIYMFAIRTPDAAPTDPLVIGAAVYTENCAGCHQADGSGVTGGGVGQQLNKGHVLATFPDPLEMVHWISFGALGGARADGTYGDPNRPGGAMNVHTLSAQMSAWGTTLSPEEIAAVTIYVRETLSGGKPADDPGFNSATFATDPTAAEAQVSAVIALGPGGSPDVSKIPGAETGK